MKIINQFILEMIRLKKVIIGRKKRKKEMEMEKISHGIHIGKRNMAVMREVMVRIKAKLHHTTSFIRKEPKID